MIFSFIFTTDGITSQSSRPHQLLENGWTRNALENDEPLLFFAAIWKAESEFSFDNFLRQD